MTYGSQIPVTNSPAPQYQYAHNATLEAFPSDMQTHVQRAQEVGKRLASIHAGFRSLIESVYGEGQDIKDNGPTPPSPGLNGELSSALSEIESIAEQLGQAATRLARFAPIAHHA